MNRTIPINGLFATEYFDLYSAEIQATFRIFVSKPEPIETGKLYPVIYALDGNAAFASVSGSQRMLTQGGEVPAAFVVGIGYPGDSLWDAMASRNRDYAPTDPGETEMRATGSNQKAGGTALLSFISNTLKPLLQAHYPIDGSDSTLQGISLGGLFGTWVLLNEPATFRRYILGSPAIWWRNQQVWEWEEQYANKHTDLPATVFIGAGALETEEHLRRDASRIAEKTPQLRDQVQAVIAWNDTHGWPEVAHLVPQLASRLRSRKYAGLRIHSHVFPDENHMSAPPAMTTRGLRYVFGSWTPASSGE